MGCTADPGGGVGLGTRSSARGGGVDGGGTRAVEDGDTCGGSSLAAAALVAAGVGGGAPSAVTSVGAVTAFPCAAAAVPAANGGTSPRAAASDHTVAALPVEPAVGVSVDIGGVSLPDDSLSGALSPLSPAMASETGGSGNGVGGASGNGLGSGGSVGVGGSSGSGGGSTGGGLGAGREPSGRPDSDVVCAGATTWLSIQPFLHEGQRGSSGGRGVPQKTQELSSCVMASKHTGGAGRPRAFAGCGVGRQPGGGGRGDRAVSYGYRPYYERGSQRQARRASSGDVAPGRSYARGSHPGRPAEPARP